MAPGRMSKGFVVYPLTKQPRENVVDEKLIRDCIFLPRTTVTDEDRLRIVGNREEALLEDKTQHEIKNMELHRVETLIISFRRIGRIENMYGLGGLTELCLDNNHIKRIENIGHLTKLQILNLSYNCISKIEGLETLTELDSLSLFSNSISTVEGLDTLSKLTCLSLGKNLVENLDDTARYLHGCRSLRVLTLKGCKVESAPHYRSRVIAFIATLRFLDGGLVKPDEIARAREEQRENLLPIEETDELRAASEKAACEALKVQKEYEQYNCPDENKLYDELLQLQPDNRNMQELFRSELVISSSKEALDRYQNDFNEKAKELADAMKVIHGRRDADERAYQKALKIYNEQNTSASKAYIKAYEARANAIVGKGVAKGDTKDVTSAVLLGLRTDLQQLQSDLIEKEADQFDVYESLHTGTLAKWKSDGVDVLIQTAFETLFRMEGDFQSTLRQIFDTIFEQRQKREKHQDEFYFSKNDESIAALLDNREEYQKVLAEWYELRRKRLEDLELFHLKKEETLLSNRAATIVNAEQDRHRNRLKQISDYVLRMTIEIDQVESA